MIKWLLNIVNKATEKSRLNDYKYMIVKMNLDKGSYKYGDVDAWYFHNLTEAKTYLKMDVAERNRKDYAIYKLVEE